MKRIKLPPSYVEGAETIRPFQRKTFHKGEWVNRPWHPSTGGKSETYATNWNGSLDNAVNTLENNQT